MAYTQNNKTVQISTQEYLIVLLLIFTSGNPLAKYIGEYVYVIFTFFSILYYFKNKRTFENKKNIINNVGKHIGICLFIFFCQYIIFGWNTLPGIINFICKIIFGATVVIYCGYKFKIIYLRLLTLISIISLVGWTLKQIDINIGFISIPFGESAIFYNNILFHPERNSGCFWEPGAYACYLLFNLILFSTELKSLVTIYKKESIILFLALISTQSTTGYLAFFAFFCMVLIFKIKSMWKYIFLLIFIPLSLVIYNNTEFLSYKIENQVQGSFSSKGEYNSTRLGSLLFDWKYIQKHPIVGNGLHERTRYRDDLYLIREWKEGLAMSGNGFSGRLAEMGLLFYVSFVVFFFKTNKSVTRRDLFLSLFLVVLLLQGEQLFNYPLLSVLPFIVISRNKRSKRSFVSKHKMENSNQVQVNPFIYKHL